jgi:NADH:ubiquinone oxidoreductase subunit E
MSQPKALFLADVIKADPASKTHHDEAAAELRRLHAENGELLEALKLAQSIIGHPEDAHSKLIAAAIAKAEGEKT